MNERERIEEVLLREVEPGVTTLGELATMLDCGSWLRDDDVIVVGALGGKIPVQWTAGDTVIALRLPDDGLAYLRIRGKLSMEAVAETLRGGGDDDSRGRVIEERAVVGGGTR